MVVSIAFILLLRCSIATPLLTPLPSTSFPNSRHNHARTIPDLDHPNIFAHPTSAIGLTQSYPVCDSTALGVPTLWTDCVHAYNQMEEEDTARVTGYVGNSENMEVFSNLETASMDYLGIPRLYWFGEFFRYNLSWMQRGGLFWSWGFLRADECVAWVRRLRY